VRWLLSIPLVLVAACSGDTVSGNGGCVSSGDCTAGEVCLGGKCSPIGSGGCTGDEQCGANQYCDPATRRCADVVVVQCQHDSACPPHQRCNTSTGVCVDGRRSCASGAPCPGAQRCHPTSMQCVDCVDASHCSGGAQCADGTCFDPANPDTGVVFVPDSGSTPGPDGGVAVDASGPTCQSDPQCGPPQTVCEGGQCTLGCGERGGLVCTAPAVCNTTTGRCVSVQGPCTSDAMCTAPRTVCEGGQCVPGCAERGGIQCTGGMVCNAQTGRCAMGGPICLSDRDCRPPMTICNLNTGQCDPGCGTRACTPPATCDAASGHCRGGTTCMDDNLEDNDTRQTATMIGGGSQPTLGACAGDDDFYAIMLNGGSAMTVNLSFQHGEGNIDLELLDGQGRVVASSRSTTDNEQITYMATAAGTFYLRVTLTQDLGPTPGNRYGLNVSLTGPTCPQDAGEPNNAIAQARMAGPGTYLSLNVCAGDDDYYAITAQAGQRISVDLVFLSLEGDIDLDLVDANGRLLAQSAGIIGPESVDYDVTATGTYYARVYLAIDLGSNEGNNYVMTVDVAATPPPPMCAADSLEENDSAAMARALTPGNHASLNVCTGDDDFYSLSLAQGDVLDARLTFTHNEGDIDMELLNAGGSRVASALSSTNNENFTYTAPSAGTFTLRVWLGRDTGSTLGNNYSMNLGVTNPTVCVSDAYEPNEDRGSARALAPGSYADLVSCTGSDDWYAVDAAAGSTLRVDLTFSHAEGDVDVALQNSMGTVLASGVTATDNETMTYAVTAAGTYYVRVYLYRDTGTSAGNRYSMTIAR